MLIGKYKANLDASFIPYLFISANASINQCIGDLRIRKQQPSVSDILTLSPLCNHIQIYES
jgi:hypothetical protein